jgi:tetratricopeptide (TPR) repeat protein
MRLDVAALALVTLLSPGPVSSQQPAGLADELGKGKRLVSEQKYQEAVAVLVGVVAKLPWTGPDPVAAEAFLQLGLAYAGLGQESQANLQFLQALRRDPKIAPDPQTTPAGSLKVFASAVKEAGEIDLVEKSEKKRGKGIWVAAGAGALLAGGALVLAGGESAPAADNGSVPMISNLFLGPIQSVDNTVGFVPVEFDFQDADADINTVSIWFIGFNIANNPLPEAAAQTAGHVRLAVSVNLPPRGVQVSVQVTVRDRKGLRSNMLRGTTSWP